MTAQAYRQLILDGIDGLPAQALNQVTEFVYFVRQRSMEGEPIERAFDKALLKAALRQMTHDEQQHLEREFEGYEQRYPKQ